MLNILNYFRKSRLKLLKKEIKEKEKLCTLQATLNSLYAEEQILNSEALEQKKERKIEEIIPKTVKYLESI